MANKKYFLEATKEVEQGNLDEALWAKQLAVAKGDEEKAKYEYIAERATILQKEAVIKFFNPLLKKYIPRFLILVGSLFIILLIIDNSNQRKAETQRIASAKLKAEIDAAAREIRIEKEKAEKEKAEKELIAIEKRFLGFENSLSGLKCVIETDVYKEKYDPFYLIISDDEEINMWGKSDHYVFWENHTRLKYAYPRIFTGYEMMLQTRAWVINGDNLSIGGNRRKFSTSDQIITGVNQSKLYKYDYDRFDNFDIDLNTLKFYLTLFQMHGSNFEVTGSCTKISYDKILEIVDQAQRRADPDKLYRE